MRTWILAAGLALATSNAGADGVENKWRIEVDGNARTAGRIVLQVAPAKGEPIRAVVCDLATGRALDPRDIRWEVESTTAPSEPGAV